MVIYECKECGNTGKLDEVTVDYTSNDSRVTSYPFECENCGGKVTPV